MRKIIEFKYHDTREGNCEGYVLHHGTVESYQDHLKRDKSKKNVKIISVKEARK